MSESSNRHHLRQVVALFFFFASLYMLTYNGLVVFNDELQMLDVTGSLVEYGDKKYDVAIWYVWNNYGSPIGNTTSLYPLVESPIELMQSLAGVPLYALAAQVPGLGLAQTTLLTNVLVSAAVCVLFFIYARTLEYNDRTALLGALLLGFGTALWPYSQTFLREPLTMFWLLLAAYLLELFRRTPDRFIRLFTLTAAAIVIYLAYNTKTESLVILPALILIALPIRIHRRYGIVIDYLFVAILAVTVLLAATNLFIDLFPEPVRLFGSYSIRPDSFRTAFHSYLFSIGGSLWGTSPLLLLAIPGTIILIYRSQRRYVGVMILVVLAFAAGHAVTAGDNWYGGATLPPRFIIPAMPLVVVVTLPLLQNLSKIGWIGRGIVALLALYSLAWQITAIALPWQLFPSSLPPEAGGLTTWLPSLNRVEYLRPIVLLPKLLTESADLTWVRNDVYLWPVVFALGAAIAIMGYRRRAVSGLLPVIFVASTGWMLASINDDPGYRGDHDGLHRMAQTLDAIEQSGDIVLLNNRTYNYFFLNHRDFDEARVVTLSEHPLDPVELRQQPTVPLVNAMARHRERLLLLMEIGPFAPWAIRPFERVMAVDYYLIREIQTDPPDPFVRLLEYSTIHAPEPSTPPKIETAYRFGDQIALTGATLPAGTQYRPGDILPVSLYWSADGPADHNYTVAMFLATGESELFVDGKPVQGYDSEPVAGFAHTSKWIIDIPVPVMDNRTIDLPSNTPPGKYEIWIRLYRIDEQGQIDILPVSGDLSHSDTNAVLPVTIKIR